MLRPPTWLWAVVIAVGCGVLYADVRAEWQRYHAESLRKLAHRVAATEAAVSQCMPASVVRK